MPILWDEIIDPSNSEEGFAKECPGELINESRTSLAHQPELIKQVEYGFSRLVQGSDHKDATFGQVLERCDDKLSVDRVKSARRFVEQHDRRIAHQLDADSNSSQLPTREPLAKGRVTHKVAALLKPEKIECHLD